MSERPINPLLKMALELGPLLIFLAVFLRFKDQQIMLFGSLHSGFVVATAVFVVVLAVATAALWALTGKLSVMQIVSLLLVLVFGGLTVWFDDPRFIKMKPTIIYLIFAGILTLGALLRRNWLQLVLAEALPMQPEGWRILNLRMIALFLGLAAANEIVWRNFSDATWIWFKIIGLTVAMVVFMVLNAGLFRRYALPEEEG
ncbi:inner membrane-spanning protein YciB [Paracoccus pacificus]|uniref:Inner membrane-spanning protein YciB n=1 Tax=Paracoccus pacificus TaxID=1463598 RepID=A0ABW4R7X2_9RHOB